MNESSGVSRPKMDLPSSFTASPKTPGHDIEAFRASLSPNVTSREMKDYIQEGNKLMQQLAELPADGKMPPALTNPKSVVAVMWALTNQTAEKGQLYISGAMRVDTGSPEKAKQIEKFFIACGQGSQPNTSYARISTHMKENLAKGQFQWGIDIPDVLPAGKRSVLFAPQPDGTLFVKMEAHGCPPFWEKGFRTFDNFKEFVGHATDFINTRGDKTKSHVYDKRKEHFPKDLKKEYAKTLDLIFPEKKSFFAAFAGLTNTSRIYNEKEFEEAGKGGIDSVLRKLDGLESARSGQLLKPEVHAKLNKIKEGNNANAHMAKELLKDDDKLRFDADVKLGALRTRLEIAQKEALKNTPDYTGDVKGGEVLLMLQPQKKDS